MDEQREYPLEFSVVMAVCNVEPYLRKCLDSDDWLEEKMFEILLRGLETVNADIAICGRYEEYEDRMGDISLKNRLLDHYKDMGWK